MALNYIQKAMRVLIISLFVWIFGMFVALGIMRIGWIGWDSTLITILIWSGLYMIFVIGVWLIVGNRFWREYSNLNFEE